MSLTTLVLLILGLAGLLLLSIALGRYLGRRLDSWTIPTAPLPGWPTSPDSGPPQLIGFSARSMGKARRGEEHAAAMRAAGFVPTRLSTGSIMWTRPQPGDTPLPPPA